MTAATNDQRRDFIGYARPAIGHMMNFGSKTLIRLLISFVPMADFLHKHRVRPTRIGSFGAGSCSHEAFLADIYPDAEIDCYDRSIKYLPAYTKEKIDSLDRMSFTEVMVEDFDWSSVSGAYDFVFSIQTLEHIEDPETALENLATTVAPGGWLYIDVPYYSENESLQTPEYMTKELARQWEKFEHFHLGFSRQLMAERVERLGFTVVDAGYSSWKRHDSAFLHLLRGTGSLDRRMADRATILGFLRFIHLLLQTGEDSSRDEWDDIDTIPHADRPVLAIRVLARRNEAG